MQAHLAGWGANLPYMKEGFKDRMKRIRLRAGFKSQADAAEAIGCDRGTVGMWEAPSSPVQSLSSDWLFQVAQAYKVRANWINQLDSKDDGFPTDEAESLAESVSHSVRYDAGKMEKAAEYVLDQFERWDIALRPREDSDLITGVYEILMRPSENTLVHVTRWLTNQVAERGLGNVGQGKIGSSGGDDRRADTAASGRTAKAKASKA